LDAIARQTTSDDRFYTATTVAFGAIALLLAVAGLYGVTSRTVTERAPELAIRSALGAEPRRLVRRTVVQQLQPVALGLLLGLTGVYSVSRLLERFLFEVSPLDPWVYVAAPALLLGVAYAGCLIPARRILGVDALATLRAE
jgi:putative ABC transport system permease protein